MKEFLVLPSPSLDKMESGLQSNEVRIPKTATSTSFKLSGVFSAPKAKGEEPGGPASNPPDFDLGSPCQYFKSSFARSLSMHSHQTKSLDFGVNFGLSRSATIREMTTTASGKDAAYSDGEDFDLECPPPLPLSEPPSLPAAIGNGQMVMNGNSAAARNTRNAAAGKLKNSAKRRSFDSTEIEVLRLRKECQNLVEENRRLMGFATGTTTSNLVVPANSTNIEAVILQTQVETLQWQLKQVEASREMYRAVMEEVVRFLERCHHNLDSIQTEQIARSKSIHYVCRNDSPCENNSTAARARSSTNLIDGTLKYCPGKNMDETFVSSLPAAVACNNFRDYTWKRSPKRNSSSQLAANEFHPAKLAQEAFRLLRTAQNLLHTQEPDLTQPKPSLASQYKANSSSPLPGQIQQKSSSSKLLSKQTSRQTEPESFCLTFSRKLNMRESRSSLRSSTDGSVHSTSSSKTETDEENCSPPNKETAICSTEDESGFSSISSFQEIGLPLHSTMISHQSDDSSESNTEFSMESRNSTLKASHTTTGLPQPNHRRWDSAPVVPPRPGLHLFSSLSGEESSSAVLWV